MFLHNIKTNSMVCDFQLVYESDGRILLDLYAYAQVREAELLETKVAVNYIDCGLISISYDDYEKLENQLNKIVHNSLLLKRHVNKMSQLINVMILKCNAVEKDLIENRVSIDELYNLFWTLVDVMAYRRLADRASDLLVTKINTRRLNTMKLPSYLIILQNQLDNLGTNPSKEQLAKFIWEYGYLGSFSISQNKYEDEDYLKGYVKNNKNNGTEIKPLAVLHCPSNLLSESEDLFYDLSWYSECKHIYQLRILRNLRKYMQMNDFDIIKTDARSLFENV